MTLFAQPVTSPATTPSTLAAALQRLLRAAPPRCPNEAELQAHVHQLLLRLCPEVEREAHLGAAGRIDFLAGRIGIELKTQGSSAAITRQLWRYAECPKLDGLLLVTTRLAHSRIAESCRGEMAGKPFAALCLADLLL